MKAKRLTALALAALMAASTTSVALASAKSDYDLDFKMDGYYKYDEDEGRIVPAKYDDFAPGDKIYLRLVEDTSSDKKSKSYHAYEDFDIGESWVKDVDVVYRKGNVIASTTYDWKFTFDGTAYTGTGEAKNDDATKQSLIDSKLTEPVKNAYVSKYWETREGYEVGGKFYADAEAAAVDAGFEKRTETVTGEYTYNGKTGTLDELGLATIPAYSNGNGYIYGDKYYGVAALDVLKAIAEPGEGIRTDFANKQEVYVADDQATYGEVSDAASSQGKTKEVYVFHENGKMYYIAELSNAEEALLNLLKGTKSAANGDYYIDVEGSPDLGKVVKSSEVKSVTGEVEGWYSKKAQMSYANATDALASLGKTKQKHYVAKGATGSDGTIDVVNTTTKLNEAIAEAKNSFAFTAKTNTSPQYDYWVEITTKTSSTTKDNDIVGDIWVGSSSKNSAKKDAEKENDIFRVDITLSNANPEMDDEYEDYVSIEPDTRAVVKFADDASDEFEVEFGDDARFVFNARGQGKLNLAYNTKYNKDFAYDYDDANIDFINFEGEPTTNRTGTLYIYADEDSYIYEVTSKGAKKINGAYYDDDEEAWVIRTRNLTSYAISDKKLKTVDQMDNGSSSNSSNKPDSSNNKPGNGKPNPDTGR